MSTERSSCRRARAAPTTACAEARRVASRRQARAAALLAEPGWMTAEGAIGIAAGVVAGASPSSAGAWARRSRVAAVIVWRFTGPRTQSDAAELRAQRLVAISFYLLAPFIAVEAVRSLAGGEHPDDDGGRRGDGVERGGSCRPGPGQAAPRRALGSSDQGRGRARTCSAPIWRPPSWSAWSATRWLGLVVARPGRRARDRGRGRQEGARPGAARAAAPSAPSRRARRSRRPLPGPGLGQPGQCSGAAARGVLQLLHDLVERRVNLELLAGSRAGFSSSPWARERIAGVPGSLLGRMS